jgi:molybdopterin-guanine dinucleotide biosynthesis protein A
LGGEAGFKTRACAEKMIHSEVDAAGFVLAGGQSSRMGQDKALIKFAGRPLVEHAVETLKQAGLSVAIAGARPEARASLEVFARVIVDAEPRLGPLGGICAALTSTDARYGVFLPVDLPLLPASLIDYFLGHARITGRAVTVASVGGFTQTFPAVVDRTVLPVLRAELKAGRGGCLAAFNEAASRLGETVSCIAVEMAAQAGQVFDPLGLPPGWWFHDLDTLEDLERATELLKQRIG